MVDDRRVCCWFISLHSYSNFSLVQDMKLVITLERSTVHYCQVCKKSWVIQCSQSSLFSQCSHRCCFMPFEIMLALREEWYCRGNWNCSHVWQQKMKTFQMITSKISWYIVKKISYWLLWFMLYYIFLSNIFLDDCCFVLLSSPSITFHPLSTKTTSSSPWRGS